MDGLNDLFADLAWGGPAPDLALAAAALLFAFVAGQVVAWTYAWTHAGVSYSRSFVQSLVLVAVVVALVIMIVGSNVLVAFGLFGALAIIRFRNVLKDTRDTTYIFMELAVGLGAGTQNFLLTAGGTAFFVLVSLYLRATSFGSLDSSDALLRLTAPLLESDALGAVLSRHCQRAELVGRRTAGDESAEDLSYRLVFRDPARSNDLVRELLAIPGVQGVSMLLQGDQAEL